MDGAIKWALKELSTLELYNDQAKFKKLNAKIYMGMDSLSGGSSGCNFVADPSCLVQRTIVTQGPGGYPSS